jgi:hypothetical protein
VCVHFQRAGPYLRHCTAHLFLCPRNAARSAASSLCCVLPPAIRWSGVGAHGPRTAAVDSGGLLAPRQGRFAVDRCLAGAAAKSCPPSCSVDDTMIELNGLVGFLEERAHLFLPKDQQEQRNPQTQVGKVIQLVKSSVDVRPRN